MCVDALPVISTPSTVLPVWQLTHVPVTSAWFTVAPTQLMVEAWQSAQLAPAVMAMCVAALPVTTMPSTLAPVWQLAQAPVTCVWSTLAPVQTAVELWQLSQSVELAMWVEAFGDAPATLPLWQLTHVLPVVSGCPIAPSQVVVELWHELQSAVVAMWVVDLPVMTMPSTVAPVWQLAQAPLTSAWLVDAPTHVVVEPWQSAQLDPEVMAICVEARPVTTIPSTVLPVWQLAQVPLTSA